MDQGQDICLSLHTDLRRMSLIAVAANIWDTPNVKAKIKKFYLKRKFVHHQLQEVKNSWDKMTKRITNDLDDINYIPSKLLKDIKSTVILLGDRIYWWMVHVTKDLHFDFKFTEKIYWTRYGTIDEVKIFQLFWVPDYAEADLWRNFPTQKIALFSEACSYCQVEFFSLFLNEIKPLIRLIYEPFKKDSGANSALIILLCNLAFFGDKTKTLDYLKTLKVGSTSSNVRKRQFSLCALSGFKEAAEKYFQKLESHDRQRVLLEVAKEFLMVHTSGIVRNAYKFRRSPDILLFLLNKMVPKERHKFLKKYGMNCLKIFLRTWPYQELCLPLVDHIWNDLQERDKIDAMTCILNFLSASGEFRSVYRPRQRMPFTLNSKIGREILQNILERTGTEVKRKKFRDWKKIVFNLFKVFDSSTINLIINDNDLLECRAELLKIGDYLSEYYFSNAIDDEDFGNMCNCIKELDILDDEKKYLEQKVNGMVLAYS